MKNISLAFAGLLFSGLVSAVQLPASGSIAVTACDNLNEDVSINLTAGVVAGADCTATRVAFSACHTAGMLKSRSVGQKTIQVADPDPAAAPGATIDSVVSCTVGSADAACQSVAVKGAAVPSATSIKGTVNNEYPGTGTCTVTVAENVAKGL